MESFITGSDSLYSNGLIPQHMSTWDQFTNWMGHLNNKYTDFDLSNMGTYATPEGIKIVGKEDLGSFKTREDALNALNGKYNTTQGGLLGNIFSNGQAALGIAQGIAGLYNSWQQNKLMKRALDQAEEQYLFNVQDTNRKYNASLKQYNNAAYDRATGRASYINGGTNYAGRDATYNNMRIED